MPFEVIQVLANFFYLLPYTFRTQTLHIGYTEKIIAGNLIKLRQFYYGVAVGIRLSGFIVGKRALIYPRLLSYVDLP